MKMFIIVISFFIFAVFMQGVFSRFSIFKNLDSVKQFLLIGGVVGLLFALFLYQRYGLTIDILSCLIIYSFVCELYIFIFTMTIGSISVNLLFSLLKNNLNIQQINELYNSQKMVHNRIDRLMAIALIEESSAGIKLTAKGLKLANMFNCFSSFFQHTSHQGGLKK
jgi:hypothetical protein